MVTGSGYDGTERSLDSVEQGRVTLESEGLWGMGFRSAASLRSHISPQGAVRFKIRILLLPPIQPTEGGRRLLR